MMYKDQIENIRRSILPELEEAGIELVDIEFKGRLGNQVLRVFVDTPGGISLDKCAQVSSKISDILDMKDLIPGKYNLEVSSPGLDRLLRHASDFKRHVGEKVLVAYQKHGEPFAIEGTIQEINRNGLLKIIANSEVHEIALKDIRKAKLVLPW